MKTPTTFQRIWTLRALLPLLCAALTVFSISTVSANTVQWTGGGDGTTWSDANNWWDLDDLEARVPGLADTVLFDSDASLPAGLQDINLTGDASVNDILFQGTGAHAFRISTGNASKLTLNEATAVKILVAQNSTVNAEFDLELSLLNGSNRDIRNRGTGTVTLGPNVTTDPNDYTFRFLEGNHAMNSTLVADGRIRLATNATVTTNQSGGILSGNRPEIDVGSTMLFQSDAISSDAGDGRVRLRGTGTAYLGASGNDDVRFQIGRFEPDQVDNTFEIVANPNGSGNLTVAVTRWDEGGQFVTIPGSTIELSTDMEAAANPGISGGGNLLVNATGMIRIERNMTYTGKTIVQNGTVLFDNTTNGTVAPETVLEVGENGTFWTMTPQTVSGLNDHNGTAGTVGLIRAASDLIIDSAEDSAFGGLIDTGGTSTRGQLTLRGGHIFTMTAGGLIDGIREIAVENGVFTLAGARVLNVTDLSAASATLGFELFGGDVGATLIDLTGSANITDTMLELSLGSGFLPAVGNEFTLLSAPTITGASVGGNIFQYTDGEEFFAAGQLFRIDYINGNDAILLTVIPEPQTVALMALFGFLVLCQRTHVKRAV